MSFHEYYNSRDATILHEIFTEIYALKLKTNGLDGSGGGGTGGGGTNYDDKFTDFPDGSTIIQIIIQKINELI
jgi:hypothetical protein